MTKELREKYRQAQGLNWSSQKMIDYCCKQADIVYQVRGYLVDIDKPRIETRFCFGFGYCGVSSMEDEQRASDMANYAQTSESYFIRENLKDITQKIETLEENHYIAYLSGNPKTGLGYIGFCYRCDDEQTKRDVERFGGEYFALTDEERKQIAGYYRIERERFTKRLNAYLKRYGLSKVHSWTYLSD